MSELTIGVLGGMGPESTADLLSKITRCTPVSVEQDHLHVIVDSNPKIPDRTAALASGNTSEIIAALRQTARNLERAGSGIIGMPCNTAHAFLDEVRAAVGIRVVDMVAETARRAREVNGVEAIVGIIATDGTVGTGLYHDAMAAEGLSVVTPGQKLQRVVMETIHEVKVSGASDAARDALDDVLRDVTERGATALVAGCTEVSLLFQRRTPSCPWLDPLQVLAEALVREAVGAE